MNFLRTLISTPEANIDDLVTEQALSLTREVFDKVGDFHVTATGINVVENDLVDEIFVRVSTGDLTVKTEVYLEPAISVGAYVQVEPNQVSVIDRSVDSKLVSIIQHIVAGFVSKNFDEIVEEAFTSKAEVEFPPNFKPEV